MTEAISERPGTDPDDDLSPFGAIRNWIFDLDDTLYTIGAEMAEVFDGRMRSFIARELGLSDVDAATVQNDLFRRHGATARGLMIEHGVKPDDFLDYVHDVDHSVIDPDPALSSAIATLPGRRYILTNSPDRHARQVIERLGADGHFDDIFDFARAGSFAKPHPEAYGRLIANTGLVPGEAAMFEDIAGNLRVPKSLGMATVLVVPPRMRTLFRGDWDLEADAEPHVDYITENLTGFLSAVLAKIGAPN